MSMIYGGSNVTFPDGTTQNTSPSGMGFKNRIINGAMMIDQRNAGASVTAANAYTLDRWNAASSAASKYTVQQNAGAVTPPVGFTKYLGATSTSAYTVGSGDYFGLFQRIEGNNMQDLAWGTANAKTVALSFWAYSSLTGTFGGAIINGGYTRSYPFQYNILAANTWTYVTITIPGDTTGTWPTDTSSWGSVLFGLGVGSTYSAPSGAWAAGNYNSANGSVNVISTNGATFYITGVQLEKGSTATSFDVRPYGSELALCQRYFVAMGGTAYERFAFGGWWATSTTSFPVCPLPVPVRSPSAVSVSYNSLSNFTINGPGGNPTSITVDWMGKNNLLSLNVQVSSGATVGQAALLYDNGGGNARLYVSNEL